MGVVTFCTSAPKTILITPNTNYQVVCDGDKYTVFVDKDPKSKIGRNFPINHPFKIPNLSPLEPLLIQAAFHNVCLRIEINDDLDPEVIAVEIPAKS
jgi:hypothetical protein